MVITGGADGKSKILGKSLWCRRLMWGIVGFSLCLGIASAYCAWIGPETVGFNIWIINSSWTSDSAKWTSVGRLVKMGESSTPGLVKALRSSSIRNPSPLLVEALGGTKDHNAVEALKDVLSKAISTREVLVWAIGNCGVESDAQDLLPLLTDSDVRVRLSAVRAITSLAATRSFKILVFTLKDQDERVRTESKLNLATVFGYEFKGNSVLDVRTRLPDSPAFVNWLKEFSAELDKLQSWWRTVSDKFPNQIEFP